MRARLHVTRASSRSVRGQPCPTISAVSTEIICLKFALCSIYMPRYLRYFFLYFFYYCFCHCLCKFIIGFKIPYQLENIIQTSAITCLRDRFLCIKISKILQININISVSHSSIIFAVINER